MDKAVLFENFEPVPAGRAILKSLSNMVEAAADRGTRS
jgi:hypothetical protein